MDINQIKEWRAQGKTYQEIGDLVSPPVSRQRIHQILSGYKNRPDIQERDKAYRHKHQEEINTHTHKYKWEHLESRIKLKALYQEQKLLVLTHYGNGKPACIQCGFSDLRALSIDHIIPNRRQPRPSNMYQWLIRNNFPEGLQTLCMNCQWIKRSANNEVRAKYNHEKFVITLGNNLPELFVNLF